MKLSKYTWAIAATLIVVGIVLAMLVEPQAIGGLCLGVGVIVFVIGLIANDNKTRASRVKSAAVPRITGPGWYPDSTAVNTQRYYDGTNWTDQVQPLPPPQKTAWQAARPITIGILAAVGVIYFVLQMQGPSDSECSSQATDVALGERVIVDADCYGR